MRLTEFLCYVNDELPSSYQAYHLYMPEVTADKKVKAFKKAIRKQKKEEAKLANKGRRDGTEDIDIFD